MRLQDVRKQVFVPCEVRRELWELCTLTACWALVEGFSLAKKCSNEGRALMQLDFRQFVVKLEKMSDRKPLPFQGCFSSFLNQFLAINCNIFQILVN